MAQRYLGIGRECTCLPEGEPLSDPIPIKSCLPSSRKLSRLPRCLSTQVSPADTSRGLDAITAECRLLRFERVLFLFSLMLRKFTYNTVCISSHESKIITSCFSWVSRLLTWHDEWMSPGSCECLGNNWRSILSDGASNGHEKSGARISNASFFAFNYHTTYPKVAPDPTIYCPRVLITPFGPAPYLMMFTEPITVKRMVLTSLIDAHSPKINPIMTPTAVLWF